jgi:DNA-binding protein YbaB
MAGELDEAWVGEAIERHRRIEAAQAEYDKAVRGLEVTVRSPDDLVEVVVTGTGEIRTVVVVGNAELSRSVQSAVTAAADAARWARRKLRAEAFGEYRSLAES